MSATSLVFNPGTISIYVHWPFCLKKCPYCDFNSFVSNKAVNVKDWQEAYLNQIKKQAEFLKDKTIKTIFFGGGTPSLMKPELVHSIISAINKLNQNKPIQEVTLESNPSSIEINKLKDFKSAGVTRISIGVQSFKDSNLKLLGRNHDSQEAVKAIESANKIFNRVSFDLINGLPGQTLEDWKTELQRALPLVNSHLSVYELTIEEGTAFFKQKVPAAKSKLAVELFNYTMNTLSKQSIYPYEISNYAKIGQESLHNLQYWQGGLYLGIGPGAHGRVIKDGSLYATTSHKNPEKWLTAALKDTEIFSEFYSLTKEERLLELLVLNLRLYKKIPQMLIKHIKEDALAFLEQEHLLKKQQDNLYITLEGKLRLNSVAEYLSNNLKFNN